LQQQRLSAVSNAVRFSVAETLRNGQRIEIRALRPEDRDNFVAAVSRVGTQSLYRRFFAVRRHFTEDETSFYLNVDFRNHVALVAIVEESGRPTIVAGGRYIVVKPGRAEVAFTVLDQYQGRGIGAVLLRHLAAIAKDAGLKKLIADVLPENGAMLKVFRRSGFPCSEKRETGSINVELELG
jgi:GNAT superfamily N-acetyltransferase